MRVFSPLFFIIFFFLFFSAPPSSSEEILFAHYTFDDGSGTVAADTSGNNHHGTLAGPSWITGRLEGALQFDGQDDRVSLGNIDIAGSAITLMAWIKIDSFTGNSSDGRIISKASGVQEADHFWMLSTINDGGTKLRFRLKTEGTTTTLIGGDLAANAWFHTAAVYDGSSMRLYLDGTQVAVSSKTGVISQNNSVEAWIGDQPPTAGTRPWNGIIDDLRIYESALTESEIQLAMNNGNAFPLVQLTAPADGQIFMSGATVQLSASASDPDGTIQLVEFYEGLNKIAETFTSPYHATWQNVPDGTYQITAKTYDDEDSFTISSPPHQIIIGSGGPAEAWVHKSTATSDLEPPTAGGSQQTASLVLDINRDGITDFIVTDRSTQPSIVWYESNNLGTWQRKIIEPERLPIEAGGSFTDIDNDGDLDILFAGDGSSNHIWWWENPYPSYTARWPRRFVKNSGANKYHDQIFGDFDGDGAAELASWNQGAAQLLLFEIPADPRNTEPWSYISIASASSKHEGMAVFDVDNDGKDDIIGAGRWYKHISGTKYSEFLIDANQTYGRSAAGQFIPGGYAELVFGPGDSSGDLQFYQYDATGGWNTTLLRPGVDHGHSLHTADFNNDGHLDIFCAEMRLGGGNSDAKSWIFYGDGKGNFTETLVAEGFGNHESRPADLDDDGDTDILGKPYNWESPRLDIWLNRGTGERILSLDLWQRHIVDQNLPANGVFLEAGDINSDGLIDLVAGGWWWQNPGTLGGSWTRFNIGSPLNNMAAVYDFDHDGDIDILGTTGVGSAASNDFRWAQNNGSGGFTIHDNLQTGGTGDFLQGCVVDNFGTDKQALLSWHNGGGGLHALTVSSSPTVNQWPFSLLSPTTQKEDLSSGDIDRDGDQDLLLGTIWLENDSGAWIEHTLGQVSDLHSGAEPDRNDLADIDGDGRLDAVIALENGTSIVWFKSPPNPENAWLRNIVGTVSGQGFSMDIADFDNDSDPDIIIGEHRGSTSNRVILFENNDNGSNWTQHIVDTAPSSVLDHHDGTQAVDLDLDGDLDIISLGWYNRKVVIYENKAIDQNSSSSVPIITLQPADTTAVQGQTAAFSVAAHGAGTLSYQWRRNGMDIPYATTDTLQTWPLSLGDSGNIYTCVVENSHGRVTSEEAMVTVIPATGTVAWWNDSFRFRLPITISPEGTERTEHPFEREINFTDHILSLGVTGSFDPASLRLIEVTAAGVVVNENVAFQFDQDAAYNPATHAAGTLIGVLHGTTGGSETRYFHLYFDTSGAGHTEANIPQSVSVLDNLSHKGFNSIRIDARNASWFFHKKGGGFATLLDSQGNDWIGFVNDSDSSASGWYRGIPNAVYPEDMMHPGRTNCESAILHQGPVRVTLETVCSNWRAAWKISSYFAEMTMSAADHEYWFQYEGTPGGSTEESDFIVTSSNNQTPASSEWTEDIPDEEWAYIGDSSLDRVLFLSHSEADSHPERFYRMEGGGGDGMVIFAFGRGSGTSRYLTGAPQHFTLGLLESKIFSDVSGLLRGVIRDFSLTTGNIEGLVRPELDVTEVYFGDIEPGSFSEKSVTLSNTGGANLSIGEIAFANPVEPPFYIISDTCSNQTLTPGEACTIFIQFLPADSSASSDSFDIPVNSQPPYLTVYLYSGSRPFPWNIFIPAMISP